MSRFKKMNQSVKELWVKALRSGKFKQARSTFYETNYNGDPAYCCLAVLQKITTAHEEGMDGSVHGTPTNRCLKEAGLGRFRPDSPGICGKLMLMNDDDLASFKEIADFIEENL